jgi:hypothetical protein
MDPRRFVSTIFLMEIEVHQRGGILGMDRRYVVKGGRIEVIDKGRSRGSRALDPKQRARIDELASCAAHARVRAVDEVPVSDSMETNVAIRSDGGSHKLNLRSGDQAPAEVWDLIGEVSRASEI